MKKFSLVFMVFVLAIFLACDDNDSDTMEMESEPTSVPMKGFFASIDENNMNDCQSEDLTLMVEDELVIGSSNVTALGAGEAFDEAVFGYIGIKTESHIAASYVTSTREGSLVNPGVLYLRKKGDIYVGFWGGEATRPEGNPSVVCPYIMVPAGMAEEDGCEAEAYSEYLKNEDGLLKTCTAAPNN